MIGIGTDGYPVAHFYFQFTNGELYRDEKNQTSMYFFMADIIAMTNPPLAADHLSTDSLPENFYKAVTFLPADYLDA